MAQGEVTLSTPSYLWTPEDMLGQGATASVYKARNKKTGQQVAVKVFNMVSYNRPYEVQAREFETLRRLCHRNVIRLHTVEQMSSNQRVLVMEYCSGGSLQNMLEEPENAFGLPETEFLIVLQCIVQGMNHLRENDIIHRDIKPGNIMRQVGECGKSIYKLTDFGAARELDKDEGFLSIYGTEEYLHPDMYGRGVLKQPQEKLFGITVDLWSIGVTFYHVATGSLPFVPYGGPRKNKVVMHKITTEKPDGAISGVQKVENGPIEWSRHLPRTCLLSQGLQALLVPVVAGILQADQTKCWTFDHFFKAMTDLLNRECVHLFSVQQATAHCIYIQQHNTISMFFEEVACQTGVEVPKQRLLYLGHDLPLEGSMKVINLPLTSPSKPIMLLGKGLVDLASSLDYKEAEAPAIPPKFDVVADYSFTKTILGVIHQHLRIGRMLYTQQEVLLQGYYCYMMKMRQECEAAMLNITMVTMRLQTCLRIEHNIETMPRGICIAEQSGSAATYLKLFKVKKSIPSYTSVIQVFQKRLEHFHIEHAGLAEDLTENRSCQKIEVLLEKIVEIHEQFCQNRQIGKLLFNDEQIHKFEKINLSNYIKRVKSEFRDVFMKKYRELWASTSIWSSVLQKMQSKLEEFRSFCRGLLVELDMFEEHLYKYLDTLLCSQQPGTADQTVRDSSDDEESIGYRMHHLKEEMEMLVRELQCNNNIIESLGETCSLGAVNSPSLKPCLTRPYSL